MKIFKWLLALPVALWLVFNAYAYGNLLFWRSFAPSGTMFMREGMLENPQAGLDYRWVPYPQISINLKKALIASEDANFAEHDGFDWNGIQAAMQKNKRSGRIRAGGSTISQQLSKNLFLWSGRNFVRKGQEAFLTSLLESTTGKERIFALYLNVIEWGKGIYGAEAASQYYFHKSAAQLTPQEAAKLAAMVPNPKYFQDHQNDPKLRRRTNIILRRMGAAELPQ